MLAPVTAIVGYSELLYEEAVENKLEEMLPDLDRVLQAARQLFKMADRMLDVDANHSVFHASDVEAVQRELRHDLRTPINGIKGYAELLLEELEDLGGNSLRPDFTKLLFEVNKLLMNLDRIVNFSGTEFNYDINIEDDAAVSPTMFSIVKSIRPVDTRSLQPEETGYILVVDDIETNRELLSRRLRKDGHQVAVATGGQQALEMLSNQKFDLVLLDLMMPGLNGFQVLDHMKSNSELNTLPVIMVSAFDETDSVIRCIEAGADDYLPKPINPILLRARIKAGLEKKLLLDKDRQQKKFIREAFSRYVSPAIVDQLVKDPSRLSLGGEWLEITCIFTDLAGFTTLIEKEEPTKVLPLLNNYLDGMCKIVREYEGTIDKIVGDALHVFFGAPIKRKDHALQAIACAISMDAYAKKFKHSELARAVDFGATRIGVHTGPAVVGNFGGDSFFDYTAHGDTVNTAARLESVNRHFGTSICVSETTVEQCPSSSFRPIGTLMLKGKTVPVDAFEPVGVEKEQSNSVAAYLNAYELMKCEDSNAITAFSDISRRYPQDMLIKFHADRLENNDVGTLIQLSEK
ncbi:response regulator [Pseudomonadota bacterium]